jgi:hypothetical protein
MATQSQTLESEQTSKLETEVSKIDLSAIAAEHPVNQKTAMLDLNTFDATQLTLLEVLDMSDIAEVEPERLGTLLSGRTSAKKMRMLYAMAWCIARRANPKLTFDEVCTWKLQIVGEVAPGAAERAAKRAALIVGTAELAGVPPAVAGSLTVAEINAYKDRRARQNRAARRKPATPRVRRRRAG